MTEAEYNKLLSLFKGDIVAEPIARQRLERLEPALRA